MKTDLETVQQKIDMCNVLADMTVAQDIMKKESNTIDVNPIDQRYKLLECDLTPVDPNSEDWKMIETYVNNTGPLDSTGKPYLKILQIFKVNRHPEGARFAQHDDIEYRKLLWHGTNVA